MQGVVTNESNVRIHFLSHWRRGSTSYPCQETMKCLSLFDQVQSSIKRNLGQVLSVLSRNRNLPRQGQYGNNGSDPPDIHLVFEFFISRINGGVGVFTHSDETGPVWRGDDLLYLWSVFCVLTND